MSTAKRNEMMKLIKTFSGQHNVISIPRIYVNLTGDYTSAALLNQILYWSERTTDPDGWFYHSSKEWEDELGLTNYQIKRAIEGDKRSNQKRAERQESPKPKKQTIPLKDLGVETTLRKSRKGAPTTHYRIDETIFTDALMTAINQTTPILNNVQNPILNNVENGYSTMSEMDFQQSSKSYTKTTAKTNAKNTTKKKDIPSGDGASQNQLEQNGQATPDNIALNENEISNQQAKQLIIVYMQYASSHDKTLLGKGLSSAKGLIKDGITLDDIKAWYEYKSQDKWTIENRNGVPTWNMLTEQIVAWKRNRKPVTPAKQKPPTKSAETQDSATAMFNTDEYRKRVGLPDITQAEMPEFLKESAT